MVNKNVLAALLVALVGIVGAVVVLMGRHDEDHATEYLMVLVTVVVVPVIATMSGILKENSKTIKNTEKKVDKLANGEMDAKIEKVVRRVLEEFTGSHADREKQRRLMDAMYQKYDVSDEPEDPKELV